MFYGNNCQPTKRLMYVGSYTLIVEQDSSVLSCQSLSIYNNS